MAESPTKSGIVACPGCEAPLLVESPTDVASATITCWTCDRTFEVAGSALQADEVGLQ